MPKPSLTHVMTPEEKCRLAAYLVQQAEVSDMLACTLREKARRLEFAAAQELEDQEAASALQPDPKKWTAG